MARPAAAGRRFTSTATTSAWAPAMAESRSTRPGSFTADELTLTLSAPARSSATKSASARTPPPTVSGAKTRAAVRLTRSSSVPRFSSVAAMSR